jgi:hypothetical protein
MQGILHAEMDVHPPIASQMDRMRRSVDATRIIKGALYHSASWVIAFCYGHQWCCLIQRHNFQRFFDSDVGIPIRRQYSHSIAVPEILNYFCEEMMTYQGRLLEDNRQFIKLPLCKGSFSENLPSYVKFAIVEAILDTVAEINLPN